MKSQEYTCISFIRTASGDLIEFAALTQAEQQEARARIVENVGKAIGEYLTQHPEEIEPFCKCHGVEVLTREGV